MTAAILGFYVKNFHTIKVITKIIFNYSLYFWDVKNGYEAHLCLAAIYFYILKYLFYSKTANYTSINFINMKITQFNYIEIYLNIKCDGDIFYFK